MFCKYCGKKVEDESTFCKYCGKSLAQNATGEAKDEASDLKDDNTSSKGEAIFDENENIEPSGKKTKKTVVYICVAVVFLFAIGFCVVCFGLLGVTQQKSKCELGQELNQYDIIKPKSKNAQIIFDEDFMANELGKHEIRYTVKNGIFKIRGKKTIEVVDTIIPEITGPEELVIEVDQEYNLAELYLIEDNDSDITVGFGQEIDITKEGKYSTTVVATDRAGNQASMDIELEVIKLSENEKLVKKVVDYCVGKNRTDKLKYGCYLYKTGALTENGVAYYVLLGIYPDNELYAINNDGTVREFTVYDAGNSTIYDYLVYAIILDGTLVDVSRLYK